MAEQSRIELHVLTHPGSRDELADKATVATSASPKCSNTSTSDMIT